MHAVRDRGDTVAFLVNSTLSRLENLEQRNVKMVAQQQLRKRPCPG